LELGGKDPMIVFKDANLDLAADGAVWGAFCNSGQSCSSVERVYVEEPIAEKFAEMVVERTKRLKQGPGDAEDVSVGAMSSERQLKIVEDHVEDFRREGARILTGGKRAQVLSPAFRRPDVAATPDSSNSKPPEGGTQNVDQNLFYEPTVIFGARNDMRAMQEETFGPTLPIATFKTEREAIEMANDSEFGLTASVWTRDIKKGERVARQLEAGSVCVNEVLYTHGIGQTPWGGFKNSGRGRTHGVEGLMELVQPQHIHINRLAILPNAWWMPYSSTAVETFRGFAKHFATGKLSRTSLLLPQLARRIRELRRTK
jgi:succinate-semialdehyde dehydrogenase/glutarate-semialdehyde dehydrogenase